MEVSALIPAYNRKGHIRRAIDSILAQTLPVSEIVVVDDGSTDGTADAVEGWYGSKVQVIRQKNTGVAGARRTGVLAARGEWIAFLDSDDEWTPEHVAELVAAAERVPPDVAWIFGDLRVVTDKGESQTLYEDFGLRLTRSPEIFADPMTVQYPFQFGLLQASLIRRKVLTELNCFTEGLRSDDDLLAGFQVASRYRVAAIDSVVGKYFRTSDLQASSVVLGGVEKPDYYHSRMMAFATVIQTGRRSPWNQYYAREARGLCKLKARRGESDRALAFEQFRYGGISMTGVVFWAVAMLGSPALRAWMALGRVRRSLLAAQDHTGASEFRTQVASAASRNRRS